MAYRILVPYLDECGAVYLPGLGRAGACVRLNPRASSIWRELAAGTSFDAETPAAQAFTTYLVEQGLIERM